MAGAEYIFTSFIKLMNATGLCSKTTDADLLFILQLPLLETPKSIRTFGWQFLLQTFL